jgi:hypothetical protein
MDREQAIEILSKFDNSTKLFSLAGMQKWARLVELFDGTHAKW